MLKLTSKNSGIAGEMHVLILSSPATVLTIVETKVKNGGVCENTQNALLLAGVVMRCERPQALVTVMTVPPKNDKIVGNTAVIVGGVPVNMVLPRSTSMYGNDEFRSQTSLH
jgi:hypothetical protein